MSHHGPDDHDGYDADDGYDGYDEDRDGYGRSASRRRLTTLGLAFLGVGGFLAIIWYAYSVGGPSGTGAEPPLITAEEAPTRIRPERPGGMEVPHQDKLVFDRLNPDANRPLVERLLPPPEVPLPPPEAAPSVDERPDIAVGAEGPDDGDGMLVDDPFPGTPMDAGEDAIAALIERNALDQPIPEETAPPAAEPTIAEPVSPSAAPQEPASASPTPSPAPAPAAPPRDLASPSASSGEGGAYRVQLAAVRSEEAARAEWNRLKGRHAAALGSLDLSVVRADLGAKGVFYRVQAGPVDEARANRICETLKGQNVGCLVVRP